MNGKAERQTAVSGEDAQRRVSFRVQPTDKWNIACTLDVPRAGVIRPVPLRTWDISSTGICLADENRVLNVFSPDLYQGRLTLGDTGTFDARFRVVHHYDKMMAHRQTMRFVGCAFEGLHHSLLILIQYIVNQMQREQIARERGVKDANPLHGAPINAKIQGAVLLPPDPEHGDPAGPAEPAPRPAC
jgi:c-di-GMP-binding flagellar brake protein YcgR